MTGKPSDNRPATCQPVARPSVSDDMSTFRWLEGERRERQRAKLPSILLPLERMLTRRPWLAGLASVRALWSLLYAEYADTLAWAPATPPLAGASRPERRAALLYFTNITEGSAIARAYRHARSDIDVTTLRVVWLACSSRSALDTAIAEVAVAVRQARATRRAAVGACR